MTKSEFLAAYGRELMKVPAWRDRPDRIEKRVREARDSLNGHILGDPSGSDAAQIAWIAIGGEGKVSLAKLWRLG